MGTTDDSNGGNGGTADEAALSCNPQITDSVTQSSVHTLALGPAIAAVNGYLGQAQSQTILFANMVNQQSHLATLAAKSLTNELSELLNVGNGN